MEIRVFPHQFPCFLGSVLKPFVRSSFTCFSSSFAFCPEIKLFKAVCLFFKSLLFVILTDSNVSTRSQSYPLFSLKHVSINLFCMCLYVFLFVLSFILLTIVLPPYTKFHQFFLQPSFPESMCSFSGSFALLLQVPVLATLVVKHMFIDVLSIVALFGDLGPFKVFLNSKSKSFFQDSMPFFPV